MRVFSIPCAICGGVSVETYKDFPLCQGCLDEVRRIRKSVDFKDDVKDTVRYIKKKMMDSESSGARWTSR